MNFNFTCIRELNFTREIESPNIRIVIMAYIILYYYSSPSDIGPQVDDVRLEDVLVHIIVTGIAEHDARKQHAE